MRRGRVEIGTEGVACAAMRLLLAAIQKCISEVVRDPGFSWRRREILASSRAAELRGPDVRAGQFLYSSNSTRSIGRRTPIPTLSIDSRAPAKKEYVRLTQVQALQGQNGVHYRLRKLSDCAPPLSLYFIFL